MLLSKEQNKKMFFKKIKKKLNFIRPLIHIRHKLFRLKDPPQSISVGLAWGAAVSFTPLLGLHIIICFLGTYLMKGNLLAAAAGTIVGNPWTFPFIFFLDYKIGTFLGIKGIETINFSVDFLINNFNSLFYPTLVGSVPLSICAWFSTYYFSLLIIRKYKERS